MGNSPRISVVIPCYNQAHFLPEALASVQAQTFRDWECFIVNDGSPDDTARVAAEWMKRDARFRSIEKPNGGLSSARNRGIAHAGGELILPLDADDLIADTYLEKAVSIFQQDNVERVVACQTESFGVVSRIGKPRNVGLASLVHCNSLAASAIYRKALWEEIGGYDEQMLQGFEDWEFWIRAACAGAKFHIIEEPLFKYRRREESMLSGALSERPQIMEYLLKKHGPVFKEYYEAAILGREKEIAQLNNALRHARCGYRASKEYMLGAALLAPLRWLKRKIQGTS